MKKNKMKWFLLSCCIGLCAILIIPQSVVLASETILENMFIEGFPAGDCPKVNDNKKVLLPDKNDCRVFHECIYGKPVMHMCPENLFFDCDLLVCCFPQMMPECPCSTKK